MIVTRDQHNAAQRKLDAEWNAGRMETFTQLQQRGVLTADEVWMLIWAAPYDHAIIRWEIPDRN
jgi:hypothetical protein